MYVFDSIIGFHSRKYPDYNFSFFDLNTGKHLLDAFVRGQGPDEFSQLSGCQQFEQENGDIKLWMYEDVAGKFHLLNISQTLIEKKTVVDSVIDIRWTTPDSFFRPNSFVFALEDNKVITKNQAYKEDEKSYDYIPPAYHLFNIMDKSKIEDIILYDQPLINKDTEAAWFGEYQHSLDRIKPDKSKIAMGMQLLCKINILDLASGELKGFRMKGTPDFKDLVKGSTRDLRGYYLNVCVDNDYIFSFYSNNKYADIENFYNSNEVHVFDWEGNAVKRLLLNQEGDYLRLDPVNKKLYTKNAADEVFCYEIKDLLYNGSR